MEDRLRLTQDLAVAVQAEGVSGLFRVLLDNDPRGGPSATCIEQADACFDSAGPGIDGGGPANSDVWGCAIGLARCLSSTPWRPPIVVPPPPPPPRPRPEADGEDSVAVMALAALLVHVHSQGKA